jgi:hypothetical protein
MIQLLTEIKALLAECEQINEVRGAGHHRDMRLRLGCAQDKLDAAMQIERAK